MRYLNLKEVCSTLDVEESLLQTVVEEGLIQVKHTLEDEVVVTAEDAERLRFIKLLVREMDVNLAGAEVILHMREEMFAIRRQFDDVLRVLVDELRGRLSR